MIHGIDAVTIFSENAEKLAKFYTEKIGLKATGEYIMGEGKDETSVYDFSFKDGSSFGIIDHKDIKGKTKEPKRVLINFETGDIKLEMKKLKRNKVKIVQDVYHIEMYGWVATCEDPDGNYFQMVQVRPTTATKKRAKK